ncbi:hypothetical protein L596_030396 [Steinernema carpocapsae]|uniref:Uncharacterized protein n=1 Tax=Steinernema carpocapsae TaxID=34508 RepID=A0A4V5ZX63_STECR|nr:hypothetical protein L596_030396 [Steinernema carpocapsae]
MAQNELRRLLTLFVFGTHLTTRTSTFVLYIIQLAGLVRSSIFLANEEARFSTRLERVYQNYENPVQEEERRNYQSSLLPPKAGCGRPTLHHRAPAVAVVSVTSDSAAVAIRPPSSRSSTKTHCTDPKVSGMTGLSKFSTKNRLAKEDARNEEENIYIFNVFFFFSRSANLDRPA